MKLELAAFIFCAFVPQVLSQFDPTFMMSMMNPDIKLPPKPPRSLFPRYYQTQQQIRQQRLEQRRRQELRIYRQLQNMTEAQILNLHKTLSKSQVHQLVQRLKYLKQQEDLKKTSQQKQGGQGTSTSTSTSTSGAGGSTSQSGTNTILSGASRVRRPGSSVNTVGSRGSSSSSSGMSRGRTSSSSRRHSRPMHPMTAMRYLQKYYKKGQSARTSGCQFPLADPMQSFMMFSRGGCRGGGNQYCLIRAMSCADVEKSILCCPPGYTTATLEAITYMKQMQAFMQQFQ